MGNKTGDISQAEREHGFKRSKPPSWPVGVAPLPVTLSPRPPAATVCAIALPAAVTAVDAMRLIAVPRPIEAEVPAFQVVVVCEYARRSKQAIHPGNAGADRTENRAEPFSNSARGGM